MKKLILSSILTSLLSANSQDLPSNAELQHNNYKEYKIQDKKLNKVYAKVMKNLSKEEKKDLRISQRFWLKYRDAECYFQSYPMRGGTGERTMELACLSNLTINRISTLKENY